MIRGRRFVETFDGNEIFRKRFRPGARTYFGVKIRNGGGRVVKVVRVGERGGLELVETGARMATREQPCIEWEPGTFHRVSSVPVRYRTAFFERTKRIGLETPVEIVRGQRDRCPR